MIQHGQLDKASPHLTHLFQALSQQRHCPRRVIPNRNLPDTLPALSSNRAASVPSGSLHRGTPDLPGASIYHVEEKDLVGWLQCDAVEDSVESSGGVGLEDQIGRLRADRGCEGRHELTVHKTQRLSLRMPPPGLSCSVGSRRDGTKSAMIHESPRWIEHELVLNAVTEMGPLPLGSDGFGDLGRGGVLESCVEIMSSTFSLWKLPKP